jgi:type II secretory pathway predicted ATPase ExeA
MYEAFYELKINPFALLPDPDFFWAGPQQRIALSVLERGLLNGSGFVVVTGEPGTGKTTLLRKFLAAHTDRFVVGTISVAPNDTAELLPWILLAFGLDRQASDRIGSFQTFSGFLRDQTARGRRVLLVVDEAQNLTAPLMEELRLLSNLNDGQTAQFQMLLFGQPDLRILLQRPDVKHFAQRIAAVQHLTPLSAEDVPHYIQHRLTIGGGGQRKLFTDQACAVICRMAGGIPRVVNQVCDAMLSRASVRKAAYVTSRLLIETGLDLNHGGLLPGLSEAGLAAITADEALSDELPETGGVPMSQNHEPEVTKPSESPVPEGAHSHPALEDPQAIYDEAMALKKEGRHQEAMDRFQCLTGEPSLALQAYAQIGICLRAAGRLPDAVVAFRKALGTQAAPLDHRTITLHYLLGRTLEDLKRWSEAASAYRRAQRLDANYKDTAARLEEVKKQAETADRKKATEGSWMGDAVQTIQRVLGGK